MSGLLEISATTSVGGLPVTLETAREEAFSLSSSVRDLCAASAGIPDGWSPAIALPPEARRTPGGDGW